MSRSRRVTLRFTLVTPSIHTWIHFFFTGGRHVGALDFLNFGRDASTSQAPGVTSVTSCRQHASSVLLALATLAWPCQPILFKGDPSSSSVVVVI